LEKIIAFIKKCYLHIWARNAILFVLIIFFNLLGNAIDKGNDKDQPLAIFTILSATMVLIFIYNHFVLRLCLFKKKYILFLIATILWGALFCFGLMVIFPLILHKPESALDLPNALVSVFVNVLITSIVYFFHFHFLKYIHFKEVEALSMKTEMESLKQQLNPHFLLNALNNLYSVSLANPMTISGKIIELSDLLKYQIETSKKDYHSLLEEKKMIEQYITYSQWKLQNMTINTNEIGTLQDYKITPMVFLPLIENAIKYASFEKNPIIHIHWVFSPSQLVFTISNAFDSNKVETFSTRSGLKNLKKRLELFHPDSQLEIKEIATNFTASITIWNLHSNTSL
jgi:sensor histidine kinase YesM